MGGSRQRGWFISLKRDEINKGKRRELRVKGKSYRTTYIPKKFQQESFDLLILYLTFLQTRLTNFVDVCCTSVTFPHCLCTNCIFSSLKFQDK